jgi:L-fucose isomerase-like protein
MNLLKPAKIHTYWEAGNPKLTNPDEQLDKLIPDSDITDVYVLINGGPSLRIAQRFNKPVIIANTPGWGVAYPASLRSNGYEGYFAQNDEMLKDLLNLIFVRKAIANTKFLMVTPFPKNSSEFTSAIPQDLSILQDKYGITYQYIDYDTLFKEMDRVENDRKLLKEAEEISYNLLNNAKNSNMTLEDIVNSVQFYQTTCHFLEKHSCNAFTIGCFELCSSLNSSKRRFTPCLCNSLLKDIGYPSACEGDINMLMSMMVQMYISRKATYMGNQDIGLADNTLKIHHSVASLKMNGFTEPETPYDIVSFTNAGFGVTLRHDFMDNLNREMTIGRFNSSYNKFLVTKGNILDGISGTGCGCEQSVRLQIPDGRQFLDIVQNYGNHLSLVYGDYYQPIKDLGKMMGFEVEAVI